MPGLSTGAAWSSDGRQPAPASTMLAQPMNGLACKVLEQATSVQRLCCLVCRTSVATRARFPVLPMTTTTWCLRFSPAIIDRPHRTINRRAVDSACADYRRGSDGTAHCGVTAIARFHSTACQPLRRRQRLARRYWDPRTHLISCCATTYRNHDTYASSIWHSPLERAAARR